MAEWRFKLGPLEIASSPKTVQKTGGGVQWFIDFMKMAAEEDGETGGVSVAAAYQRLAWVNIAVDAIASNFARAPFKLYSGDTEVDSGPVFDLFRDVNMQLSAAQLWHATEAWRWTRGEAIWVLGNERSVGMPSSIYVRDPARFEHKLNPQKTEIVLWKYTDDDGKSVPLLPAEVIQFPLWNPVNEWRGVCPWTPLADEIAQMSSAAKLNTNLLRRGAVPHGLISIPGDGLTEEEAQRVIEKWEKRHTGAKGAGRIAVLANGAKYEKVSLSPADIQYMEMMDWDRETILARAGVPKAIVGLAKADTALSGKDTKDQLQQFWNLKLIPEQKVIEDKLRTEFFARFKIALEGRFDNSEIQELQDDEDAAHARAREDFKAGLLDRTEAREIIGKDPGEPDQTFWMPFSTQPVQGDEVPEPAKPAPAIAPADGQPQAAADMDMVTKVAPLSAAYKANHWRELARGWDVIEERYRKAISDVFYHIGSAHLTQLAGKSELWPNQLQPLYSDAFWTKYAEELKDASKRPLNQAMEMTGDQLGGLFNDMGLGVSFDIHDTRAVLLLQHRLDKIKGVVDETLRSQYRKVLEQGLQDGSSYSDISERIREVRGISINRAQTIARTEIGGAVNDSRVSGYLHEDFHYHQWGTALDDDVRDSHRIDGEIAHIGTPFSNGLMYPNDPGGSAAQVCNCRCVTFPLTDEEADAGGVRQAKPAALKQEKPKEIEAKGVQPILITSPPITVNLAIDNKGEVARKNVIMHHADGTITTTEIVTAGGNGHGS